MNWLQRIAQNPSQMTEQEFLDFYSPNREGEEARTSITGTDGITYVGGRNHGELINMAIDVGISEGILINGRAGFTEPSGYTFDIHGKNIQPRKVVRVDLLWYRRQNQVNELVA